MGVKDFFKIKITNPNSKYYGQKLGILGEEIKLSSLRGNKICLDASWIIYSSILAMSDVTILTDNEGNTTAHINTVLNIALQLYGLGIEQIWIFDSPEPNELKKLELAKREKRRNQYKNSEKIQFKLRTQHVQDIKDLLTTLGMTYIIAPAGIEAEHYGAVLTRGIEDNRYCKYMISGDSDVLLFGGNLLYKTRQRTSTGKSSKPIYMIYELNTILTELDVSYQQLLEIAAALGTDFSEKTPRVGPMTVVDRIKKRAIEFTPEQQTTIKYFKSKFEITDTDMQINTHNREALITWLITKGFNQNRIELRLNKVFK